MLAKNKQMDRLKPLVLPLDVDDALRGAMEVQPPGEVKPKKRTALKAKKRAKRKQAKKK